ncbi:DUF2510 domain-containing protein [Streptomyces antnestii]|uniref:DUF2510 domain-containing protein n=1 Tax=Streptomyces antnestii TaxID=2494256 RepID=A0A437Q2Z6_9ACTN|nr:DUF2510 domain-containing protein [Streptomyces sp. San01]RVU28884.1 DUF2510 domain-containing protein [Streptomyces sp. San01]
MTQVTPPGWYPDPGQQPQGPRTERWWDGSVWTDQTRAAGAGAAPAYPQAAAPGAPPQAYGYPQIPQAPGQAGYPGYPGYPAYPEPRSRRGVKIAIAAGVAVVVLGGIVGGVYALTSGGGGGKGDRADRSSSPSGSPGLPQGPGDGPGGSGGSGGSGGPGGSGGGSGAPQGPGSGGGFAADLVNGVSLPVLDGWTGGTTKGGNAGVTTGPYTCPGDPKQQCVRGGAFSASAEALKLKATGAEAAAKEDISQNAQQSYGGTIYGKITSHKELASEAVTVAGRQGYLVRWKVVTAKGDDGYVESLVFPSPADSKSLIVVRFGIDVNDQAPDVKTMDEIAAGIKKSAIAEGGGNGQNV